MLIISATREAITHYKQLQVVFTWEICPLMSPLFGLIIHFGTQGKIVHILFNNILRCFLVLLKKSHWISVWTSTVKLSKLRKYNPAIQENPSRNLFYSRLNDKTCYMPTCYQIFRNFSNRKVFQSKASKSLPQVNQVLTGWEGGPQISMLEQNPSGPSGPLTCIQTQTDTDIHIHTWLKTLPSCNFVGGSWNSKMS